MLMDNYEVLVGDNVHDLLFGHGVVERLVKDQDKFWVRFNANSLRCFNCQGFGNFTERTLYWKNPITVVPHKHDDAWEKTMLISQAVAEHLGRK